MTRQGSVVARSRAGLAATLPAALIAALTLTACGGAMALGMLACRPSRGAERPADSADPRALITRQGLPSTELTEMTLSVREVLETPGLVRRRVRVTGICVGYPAAGIVATPPITRSDWILEADDARVFVSGPFPDGCTATTRGTHPVTIVGEVAEDTLASLADHLAVARRFLLRIR